MAGLDKYRLADAQRRVRGPATALLLTACLGAVGNLACFSFVAKLLPEPSILESARLDEDPTRAYARGRDVAPALHVLVSLLSVTAYSLVAYGGVQMLNLKNYRWALTAALLALLPCPPGCGLGLPCGLWALWVLNRSQIRDAFPR